MVINMALRSVNWLVCRLYGLKLGEYIVVHQDSGSIFTGQRVHASSTSPQFGNFPGTNCNFDGSPTRENSDVLVID